MLLSLIIVALIHDANSVICHFIISFHFGAYLSLHSWLIDTKENSTLVRVEYKSVCF